MTDMRAQIAATLFQPVPGGYVYREPYRWPFGPAPHYLVNDEQRAALLAVIVPKWPVLWQVVLWSTLCLIVATTCVGLWLYTGHETPTALDTLAMIVLTVVQVILALAIFFWRKRRRLQPLLSTLTPTDLRITRRDMRAAMTNAMSSKQLMITGVSNVIASAAMLVNAALQFAWGKPVGLLWFAGTCIFAGLAWYYLRRLVARAAKKS